VNDGLRSASISLRAMAGPERLLFEIVSRDLDPGAFRAAAALVHELDLAARERIAIHERSNHA
jgi:hypothetical protein